jgi:DNA-binding NarL/FixJ family response regulator
MKDRLNKIRIFLTDEHAISREALSNLLEQEGEFVVVGEAADSESMLSKAAEMEFDIMLMDNRIPYIPISDVLRLLRERNVKAPLLILADGMEGSQVVESLRMGAGGVVSKESTPNVLFESIRAVACGDYWIDPKNIRDLVLALRIPIQTLHSEPKSGPIGLTPRELEIVAEVADGSTNKNIAEKLSIAEQTVKHHLTSIFQKVGVANRLELAVYAMHRGIVPVTIDQ